MCGRADRRALYDTVSAESFIRSNRAKVIGVAGPKRQALIPNVPTLAEQGIKGADNPLWIGLVTAARVPRPIVDKLNRELNRVLQLPDVKQRFDQLGLDAVAARRSASRSSFGSRRTT